MIGGRVLDTSAVVDWTNRATLYTRTLVRVAVAQNIVLSVPAAALTAAVPAIASDRRGDLTVLLRQPVIIVDNLTADAAQAAGGILAEASDLTEPDAIAAVHVAHVAHRRGWIVVTGEANRLRAFAPDLDIEELP